MVHLSKILLIPDCVPMMQFDINLMGLFDVVCFHLIGLPRNEVSVAQTSLQTDRHSAGAAQMPTA